MSQTRKLLYEIASQMGKDKKDIEPIINILQKNWYDSKASLKNLKMKDYQKLSIPQRLAQIIMQKIGVSEHQNTKTSQKMQIQNPVNSNLQSLKNKLKDNQQFKNIINILFKLYRNIRQNIMDQKYRKIKKNNNKIANIIKFKQVLQVLQYGGFQSTSDSLIMSKISLERIDECLQGISSFMQTVKFNPYQSQITSLGDKKNQQKMGNLQTDSSMAYNQKLATLEKDRQRIMSKPIKNRQLKITQIINKPSKNNKQMQIQFGQEKQSTQDEKIYMFSVKQQLKMFMDDPKFINRRKQQYIDLLKKPCYSQTLIRVKLPNDWIFECKFAPFQTLQSLITIFEQVQSFDYYLQNMQNKSMNYYLYMTPPVQKIKGMLLLKTFYQMNCVPSAMFYLKVDEKDEKKQIMQIKKDKLFGIF